MSGIVKRFFAVTALQGVNFDLYDGEIHALVGENGAGKSTLMKILSGSYPASSYEGELEVNGENVRFMEISDSERAGIEMIYQEISLNLDLTIAENIFLGRLPKKKSGFIDWKRIRQESDGALKRMGLEVDSLQIVRSLSTSQQQLVSIVKALVRYPRILVLDEPTSALTEQETETLMQVIFDLKKQGISCIYISHKLDEVFRVADRITILRDGQYIATYSSAEAVPKKVIEDMVGRKIENMYPKQELPFGAEVLRIEGFTVASMISARKNIVEDVSFSVRAGEILGLGGLVGSGRSELCNAIFGAIPKKSGNVYLDGSKLDIRSPLDAVQCKMGLLTEDRRVSGFVGAMNVRENISLASFQEIFGRVFIKKTHERGIAESFARQLNIKTPSVETNVLNLSGGNQQKVVLAKWLMTDVKVLFLDEPTRGIDVGAKVEIYHIMEELARKGVAVVMISSELPELLAMCDRFVILGNSKVQGTFLKAEITQEKFMHAATGIEEERVSQ
ncbi:MAG: sugar ABC transporter ATP-binding protein [bacterium]|nr:sugar ABC transporter ATP-binding protein [bacterium]